MFGLNADQQFMWVFECMNRGYGREDTIDKKADKKVS